MRLAISRDMMRGYILGTNEERMRDAFVLFSMDALRTRTKHKDHDPQGSARIETANWFNSKQVYWFVAHLLPDTILASQSAQVNASQYVENLTNPKRCADGVYTYFSVPERSGRQSTSLG